MEIIVKIRHRVGGMIKKKKNTAQSSPAFLPQVISPLNNELE